MVHHLVWTSFVGPIYKGQHIHHKNGNCEDNKLINLECLTFEEHLCGEKNGQSKLLDKEVSEIRQLYSTGKFTQANLASKYKISRPYVSELINYHNRTVPSYNKNEY